MRTSRNERTKRGALLAVVFSLAFIGVPSPAHGAIEFTFPSPFSSDPGVVALVGDDTDIITASGTAPDGATVIVSIVDTVTSTTSPLCTETAVGGNWSCSITAGYLVGEIRAELLDGIGSVIGTISHELIVLSPPVLFPESQNTFTSTGLGTIAGVVEPLSSGITSTVYVNIEGDEVCGSTVESDGSWECGYAIDSAPDGEFDVSVTQEREALGTIAISSAATTTITLDRVGPAVPAAFTTPAGSSLVVTQPTYPLAGTAEPFATVRVIAGSETVCGPLVADAGGLWSCTASAPTVDGLYTARIEQVDRAGNAATVTSETLSLEMKRGIVVIPTPPILITPPAPIAITGNLELTIVNVSPDRVVRTAPLVFNALPFVSFTQGGSFSVSYSASQVGTIYNTLVPSTAQLVDTTTLWTIKIRSEELVLDTVRVPFGDPVELSAELPADFPVGDHTIVIELALEGYEPVEFTTPVEVIAEEEPEEAAPIEEEAPEVATPISSTDGGVPVWLWAVLAAVGVGIIALVAVMARNARRRA